MTINNSDIKKNSIKKLDSKLEVNDRIYFNQSFIMDV